MVRKRAQKGFTGSMPEFLLSQSHQQCLSATTSVKKTKFNWVHFKDLICFIHWFIIQAASHLAARKKKALKSCMKQKAFMGRKSPGEGIGYPVQYSWASLVAQLVKNPPAMRETWVRPLGWENPMEKGKVTHSSSLAWRIPWTEQSIALQTVDHDWVTFTFHLFKKEYTTLFSTWALIIPPGQNRTH